MNLANPSPSVGPSTARAISNLRRRASSCCAGGPAAQLCPAAAAAILTLADFETPLWIAPSFSANSEVAAYLGFHTGASLAASPDRAAFALVDAESDRLELASFAQGLPEYPDRSTTLIVQMRVLAKAPGLSLAGPGVNGVAELRAAPLPEDLLTQREANHAAFPLGVDLILTCGSEIAALPRSLRLTRGA